MVEALRQVVGKRVFRLSLVIVFSTLGVLLLSPWIATLLVVVGLLALVAEFDNQAGTFLPLAILVVIVLAVLVILLGMMAFLHG
jgi:hypothetical protein